MSPPRQPLVDWSELCLALRARSRRPLSEHAREAGMNWRTINRLARGETSAPRWDQAVRLLDVAADHLLPGDWERIAPRLHGDTHD